MWHELKYSCERRQRRVSKQERGLSRATTYKEPPSSTRLHYFLIILRQRFRFQSEMVGPVRSKVVALTFILFFDVFTRVQAEYINCEYMNYEYTNLFSLHRQMRLLCLCKEVRVTVKKYRKCAVAWCIKVIKQF